MKIKIFLSVLFSMVLFSCTDVQQQKQNSTNLVHGEKSDNNDLIISTLYNYYAAEYEALCYQSYNIAKERITLLRKEFPQKKNMTVVVDIDETVLNNSPFEALTIEKNINFPSCWDTWVNKATAKPVSGAVSFLRYADSLGFHIFYVTNRRVKLKSGTLENLQKLDFPQADSLHLYMKTTTGNKEPRRQLIAKKYDIVLLIGDNIGDFYVDSGKYPQRNKKVKDLHNDFGKKYIVLPNPMYGAWLSALKLYDKNAPIDSLLKAMTKNFGDTCR